MREPVRDRDRLEHITEAKVNGYLTETDWDKWEHNEAVISESAAHKSLIQTAERMKRRGYDTEEICKITGLGRVEIEVL